MNICEEQKCTGCGCCVSVCEKGAITLIADQFGNMKYKIDENKCINCGLCIKKCPNNYMISLHLPRNVYAAYAIDEKIYENAASGGVATSFYTYALKNGINIYGAKFLDDFSLSIVQGNCEEDIELFAGSKYVKSEMLNVFDDIKNKLLIGEKVLFIGLPCQVAGIKKFVGNLEKRLITIDLVCHGATPQIYFKEYLQKFKKKHHTIDEVRFRKDNQFIFHVIKNNRCIYKKPSYKDPYMLSFLKAITYTDSCYKCLYARPERCSDITICDFWGIEDTSFKGDKNKVSAILINTEIGDSFFKECKDYFYIEEFTLHDVIRYNQQLRQPSNEHPYRNDFLNFYKDGKGFLGSLYRTALTKEILKNYIKDLIKYKPK